jgi:hypothetical protein
VGTSAIGLGNGLEGKTFPVSWIIEGSLNDQLISQNQAVILWVDAGRIAHPLSDHPHSIRSKNQSVGVESGGLHD